MVFLVHCAVAGSSFIKYTFHCRADYKDFLHVGSIYRRVAVDAGTIRRIFRGPSDNVGNYKKNVGSSVNQKGGINPLI